MARQFQKNFKPAIRHDKANMSSTKRHPLTPGRGTGGSAWLDYRVAALKLKKKLFLVARDRFR